METHQHGIHPQLSHPFALLWLQTVGPTIRHVIRRTVIRTISATVARCCWPEYSSPLTAARSRTRRDDSDARIIFRFHLRGGNNGTIWRRRMNDNGVCVQVHVFHLLRL